MNDNDATPRDPVAAGHDSANYWRDADTTTPDTRPAANNPLTYTMTVEEAHQAFQAAGLPVSLRTIQRYCHKGRIQCIAVDPDTGERTDKKSFVFRIDPASLDAQFSRMRERREFEHRDATLSPPDTTVPQHDATPRDESRHAETLRDATRHDASRRDPDANKKTDDHNIDELERLREEIETLRKELVTAEVEKQAAHQAREFIQTHTKSLVKDLQDTSYKLGVTENQLRQLQAPTHREAEGDNRSEQNHHYTIQ